MRERERWREGEGKKRVREGRGERDRESVREGRGERDKERGEGGEGEEKEKLRRNAALVKESLMRLLSYILPQSHHLLAVIFRVPHFLTVRTTC